MPELHSNSPRGFVLAEALIALVILGVIFLALEGSLSLVIRSLADSDRESTAAVIAETQRERAFAAPCAPSAGVDSLDDVTVSFAASPTSHLIRVVQTTRYPRKAGERVEQYDAVGPCQ